MKAKDYAARITSQDQRGDKSLPQALSELGNVGREFYNDFVDMKKQRNVQTDQAFYALVLEFDRKFEKMAKLINAQLPGLVKSNGFIEILKKFSDGNIVEFLDGPYLEYKKAH